MKKIIVTVPALLLSALLLCTAVYAEDAPDNTLDSIQQSPENTTQTPGDDTTQTPGDDTDAPEGDTDTPEGDTDTPDEDTDTPEGDTDTTPGDDNGDTGKEPDDGKDETPEETPDTAPVKPITGASFTVPEDIDRFLKLGETPDFTGSVIELTYYDGSKETLEYKAEYLTEWETDKTGRRPAVITVADKTFTEFFIVMDESIDATKFTDVTKGYWGYKQIKRCAQAGFFVGVKDDLFGVANGMTRAQFCQMIYQIYGNDDTVFTREKQVAFNDVNVGSWYYNAVSACAESGIVNGMGDGSFKPESFITRQDVAVIMMRIILGADGVEKIDTNALLDAARNEKGIKAADFDSVSNYAKKYVAAALGVIYYGDENGNINPLSNITRAECASMAHSLFFADYPQEATKKLVYLSPSNQNSNAYAIYDKNNSSTHQYTEGLQMQLVGQKVSDILVGLGYEVYTADVDLSIRGDENSRPIEAGNMGADCYVAIHSNGAPKTNDGSYQGTTCFYNGNNKGAKELSQFIYDRMSKLTPTKDRGSLNDMLTSVPFTEVKNPTMANVLIEVEFHDYKAYAQWIVNNTDKIAEAIALGIDDYLKTIE